MMNKRISKETRLYVWDLLQSLIMESKKGCASRFFAPSYRDYTNGYLDCELKWEKAICDKMDKHKVVRNEE